MITSTQNNFIKQVNKLKTKKGRHDSNTFVIEGFHLLEEAIKSNWTIKHIIAREDITVPHWAEHLQQTRVSHDVFNYISQTETPQGIASIVKMKDVITHNRNQVLLVDAIQDPGNLGTIIRTADAAGFHHIVLGKGTVDVYNEKVIRATQGSLFHIQIEQGDLVDTIKKLKEEEFTIYASALQQAERYETAISKGKVALILGNEGRGIQEDILNIAHKSIYIPIYGKVQSLNVGVAAGVLMYAFASKNEEDI